MTESTRKMLVSEVVLRMTMLLVYLGPLLLIWAFFPASPLRHQAAWVILITWSYGLAGPIVAGPRRLHTLFIELFSSTILLSCAAADSGGWLSLWAHLTAREHRLAVQMLFSGLCGALSASAAIRIENWLRDRKIDSCRCD